VLLEALSCVVQEFFGGIATLLGSTFRHLHAVIDRIGNRTLTREACCADSAIWSAVLSTTLCDIFPLRAFLRPDVRRVLYLPTTFSARPIHF
jgi:hypothetical protein